MINKTHILGDAQRRSRFNPQLADIVNKNVEDRLKKEQYKASKKPERENTVVSKKKSNNILDKLDYDIVLDHKPAMGGLEGNQAFWISYWNGIQNDKLMASMPDYYFMFKKLYESVNANGLMSAKNKGLVADLRIDISQRLVSSTLVRYAIDRSTKMMGNIFHHYGDNDPTIIKKSTCVIPYYNRTPLCEVLEDAEGVRYLHKFFGTKDTKKKMIDVLEFISGRTNDKIFVTTGSSTMRMSGTYIMNNKIGSLEYEYGNQYSDALYINAERSLGDIGRCRGVTYIW